MAQAIALAASFRATAPEAWARPIIVIGCALALIAAGQALPF